MFLAVQLSKEFYPEMQVIVSQNKNLNEKKKIFSLCLFWIQYSKQHIGSYVHEESVHFDRLSSSS